MTLGDLFPKALGAPIAVKSLFPQVTEIRSYSQGYKIKWLDSKRPQPTIGRDHSQKPTRWRIDGLERRPTTEQLKAVSSYPGKFVFLGNDNETWNRIGNSVPPLFMYAIAAQIRYKLFNGPAIENVPMIDYPAHLEAMWQKHLAPREPNAPTVISTFAGAGGSSLGYSMAGYRELLAVEWDDNAVETFKLNFPGVPVYHGDIAKLSVDECLSMAGIEPGQLDILDGSPPCQGFSTAGKRIMDDPRNQLFREYVRLLRGLRPKVFVMENVSGMVKGKMKLVFVDILKELKASGYRVSARLLNAMYFHVPQSRERMIFIGVRDDLGIEPTHPKGEGRPVTVGDAWRGSLDNGPSATGQRARIAAHMPPGTNNGGGKYSHISEGKKVEFGLSRLSYHKPCPAVIRNSGKLFVPNGNNYLGIEQLKRVGSLPDPYAMVGSYDDKWNRIGNSVPPLFMEAIARHIRREILDAVTP